MRNILTLSLFIYFSTNANTQSSWNEKWNNILQEINIEGLVDYNKAITLKDDIDDLYTTIETSQSNNNEIVAVLINAYNLIVIKSIIDNYPSTSVQTISGFFKKKHTIGEKLLSLNQLEKQILRLYKDGRIHLALVCGAVDCPPLFSQSYVGQRLENQLDQQTRNSLQKDNIFYKFDESTTLLVTKIFQWYSSDFGDLKPFLSNYTGESYEEYRINYADYNWALNDANLDNTTLSQINPNTADSEELRYFASNLYAKGEFEINLFNNYYTQTDPIGNHVNRQNFFSTFIQALWGLKEGINIGLDLKIRSVSNGPTELISTFDALRFRDIDRTITPFGEINRSSRFGFTQIGPKIKYQPFRNIQGLTFQHTIHIPLLLNGEGGENKDYIDWGSPSIYNDFYFDHQLTQKVSLFLQVGIYGENLGGTFLGLSDGYYQLATPMTTIINYFPTKKSTVYFLVNSAPQFGFSRNGGNTTVSPNHYNQYGIGYKYFVTDKLQAEVLVTNFSSVVQDRKAATYNLGMRYFGWQ